MDWMANGRMSDVKCLEGVRFADPAAICTFLSIVNISPALFVSYWRAK